MVVVSLYCAAAAGLHFFVGYSKDYLVHHGFHRYNLPPFGNVGGMVDFRPHLPRRTAVPDAILGVVHMDYHVE